MIATRKQIYAVNEDGDVHVIATGREYKELAVNRMNAPVLAPPAASVDTLFIRTANHLYGIRDR